MAVEPIIVSILGNSTELDTSLASAGASVKAFGASATLSFAGVGAAITSAGTAIKAFGATITAVGMSMSVLVTAPIVAVGAAALLAANNVQKAYAIIIAGTGATGTKLQGLETQFDNLASTIPNSFTDTATVLTTVNNKLSEGGYAITEISKNILDVSRMTGESATSLASDFTAAITSWGVSAKDTEGFMNQVYTAAQAARVPVTSILTDLTTYKPVIESAGYSLQQMIPIIGDLESKGLDVTRTMQGIAYAWANLSKDMAAPSKTTQAMVDDVTKSMKDAGIQGNTTADQLQGVFYGIQHGLISSADAAAIFGPRFADNVYQVIKDGNLTAAQFIALSNGLDISLNKVGASTITFAQSIDIMKNALEIALNPLGEKLIQAFTQLMPLVKDTIGVIGELTSAFAALPTPVADALFVIVALAAGIGPALILVGGLVSAFGTIVTAAGAVITAIPVVVGVIALLAPVLVVAAVAVGALTVLIAPLVAALYLAYTSSDALRGALGTLEGALGTAAGAFDTLGSHITSGLSYIISGNYKAGFADFTTGFTDMWTTITNIDWLGMGENLVNEIASGISTNMPKVVTGLQSLITDADKTWDTVSKDFTTWVNGVNWTADAAKIPKAIIAALSTLQKDVTPVWNTIETSFNNWVASVQWGTIAAKIPIDISNSIQLSMKTIGPVWDYIQISLMNWIQGVNWSSIGNQIGAGLRYAIKLALDSLVGGLMDLIPTATITAGQPNLIGVGITAAKNFVSGFQSGLGDLWKLIMDGLDPLAGKLADYMEHDVDWTGIGTAIGNILGSVIAGIVGQPLAELNSTGGGNSAGTTISEQITQGNKGGEPQWGPSGMSKLQQAGDDAGNALATGFKQGVTSAMSGIDWKTVVLNSLGLNTAANPPASPSTTYNGPNIPGIGNLPTIPSWAEAVRGGPLESLTQGSFPETGKWSLPSIPSWSEATKGGPLANLSMPNLGDLNPFNWKPIDKSNYNATQGTGFGSAMIDLPSKIMGLGNTDWGKLTKGGIFDLDQGPLAPLAKADYGTEFSKLTKGGIFDLDNGPLAPLAKTNWGAIPSQVSGALSTAGATVTGAAKSIWDFITGAPKEIWTWITGTAKEVWTWITGTAHDIWTYITGGAHDIWTYITGGAHDVWSYITGGARDIWTYITGAARDIWTYITGAARDIWTYITGAARDIWTYITGSARDIWTYITGGAHDIWTTYITGGAKDLWHDLVSGWPINIVSLITPANITQFITGSIPASSTPVDQPQQGAAGTPNTMLSAGPGSPGAMPWPVPWPSPRPIVPWPSPRPIAAQTGAIFNARSGGIHALLAEAGEAEMVVPQNRWGESWTNLIRTLPHFGAGGIVGNVTMPAISASDSVSDLKNYIESAVNNANAGPKYEINVTLDAEAIKRDILQSILELEQYHHLGNMG